MNTERSQSHLFAQARLPASVFHDGIFIRSGDMRAVILSGNEAHIVKAIQEAVKRSFREDDLKARANNGATI